MQLKPKSILELGCGGGDHLNNIHVLSPTTKLFGMELSSEQIKFLFERHPEIKAEISEFDCTLPFPRNIEKVDLAYTQAVVMHIQTGNGHMVAMTNLFNAATKQVLLMENWARHDYMNEIQMLHQLKIIPWNEIYFYYRESVEYKKPHLMVVSSVQLKEYKVLTDLSILKGKVSKND